MSSCLFVFSPGLQTPSHLECHWDYVGISEMSFELNCPQTVTFGVNDPSLLHQGGLVSEPSLKCLEI